MSHDSLRESLCLAAATGLPSGSPAICLARGQVKPTLALYFKGVD